MCQEKNPISKKIDRRLTFLWGTLCAVSTSAHYNLLLDAEEVDSLYFTYGVSPEGETDDTRFIMSRKGDEVQLALEAARR